MGRRPSHGGWRFNLMLLTITCITSVAVYFAVSPFFHNSSSRIDILQKTMEPSKEEAGCCSGIEHREMWGSAVNWGADFLVNTSTQCCNACKAMCVKGGPCECNSWVFCGDRSRCGDMYRQSGSDSLKEQGVCLDGMVSQCWLKKQVDVLAPEYMTPVNLDVPWTTGLVYGTDSGIVALETEHGTIHLKLLPDCAPQSVAYILELLRLRHCAGCHFYRADSRAHFWDAQGKHIPKSAVGPPYGVLQGTLEARSMSFPTLPRESCPVVKRGMVGWVEGGPDFFVSLANHNEWYPKYTVFALVLPADMALLEKLVKLPSTSSVWSGVTVEVLKNPINLHFRRPKL